MEGGATGLGDGRIEKIGAYSHGRRVLEQEQDGCHQRAAANTGEADCKAHSGSGKYVQYEFHGLESRPPARFMVESGTGKDKSYWLFLEGMNRNILITK
jgi:hypothetical protein